jgi:hypothetical protein
VRERISDPILMQLYDYWQGKSAGRRMPERSAVDPAEIPLLLPHLLIWEVLAAGGYRCRLAGTKIVEAHRREITGLTTAELHGAAGAHIDAEYDAVAREGTPHYVERSMYWYHQDYRRYKRLLLPLSNGGESCAQILAGATYTA